MQLRTLNDVFVHATSRGAESAILTQVGDAWQPISCNAVYWRTRRLAAWLQAQGVNKGDRVALIAENRWEWAVTDYACLAIGAVDVPMFPTLTLDQTAAQLRDSGARIAIVSTPELAAKVRKADAGIETIVVMERSENSGSIYFGDTIRGDEPDARDAEFDRQLASIEPADIATIIYTSGTTGDAKGVVLTHGNIASNLSMTTELFRFGADDLMVSFLPLSHVTARHIDYLFFAEGVTLAYVGRPERVLPAMQAVKPTIFVAVPRVYERVRQSAEGKAIKAGGLKASIFQWAIRTGSKHRDRIANGKTPSSFAWKIANKLVYSKLREAFGGRVKVFVAGGAPLGIDLASWFADAGIAILEGYGLTETSPVIAVNLPHRNKLGTIGSRISNTDCRFAEDGELEVRGPGIFAGYWQKPEQTAAVMDGEWFRTGDIGSVDADGFLRITDRKRELIKTVGGKFIAPQPIENKLKVSSLIGHVALQGDRRKYVTAILSPNTATLAEWAKEQGIAAADNKALVREPRVIARFQQEFDRVNAEAAPWEKVKRFRLVSEEWTVDTGELTPSMKLKRRVVAQKYADEIESLYAGSEAE